MKSNLKRTAVLPAIVEVPAAVHYDYTDLARLSHERHCLKAPPATVAEMREGFTKTRTDWPVIEELQ